MVKKSNITTKKHKKENFEPIKVGLGVAALAATCLALFGLIGMYL